MEEQKVSLLTKANEDFLDQYLRSLNITEYKIDITSATNPGENYLGVIARIKIDSEESTLNLILKSAMQQPTFRQFLSIAEVYERESYIYSTVLKVFEELQEELGVLNPFKSYPKYYTHSLSPPNECIVLDDLKVKGYKIQDRFKPLDYNHVKLVVQEYGRYHALSFALRDQKPSLFEEVSQNSKESFFSNAVFHGKEARESVNARLKYIEDDFDPVSQKHAYENFMDIKDDFMSICLKSTEFTIAGKHSVICHGDNWINNLLFQYSDLNNPDFPTKLSFIDWQLSRLGSPVLDLAYFLYTCTDKQLRDEHYKNLIQEYYKSFSSFLRQLGSDPDKLFPYNVFQDHLKKFSIFGLFMAVQCLYFAFSLKDEVPDLQNISSAQDGADILSYKSKNHKMYTTRVIEVVTDLIKYGYNFKF